MLGKYFMLDWFEHLTDDQKITIIEIIFNSITAIVVAFLAALATVISVRIYEKKSGSSHSVETRDTDTDTDTDTDKIINKRTTIDD